MVIRPTQPFHVSTLRRPLRHRAEEGGWGVGREAEGQIRLVSGQRSLLLLVTQETPLTRVRITDVRGNSHRPLTSSPPWRRFSSLPAFRGTEKEGGAERSSGAGRLLSHLTPKHSTGHGGSRAVGWGGVGWGGVGTAAYSGPHQFSLLLTLAWNP